MKQPFVILTLLAAMAAQPALAQQTEPQQANPATAAENAVSAPAAGQSPVDVAVQAAEDAMQPGPAQIPVAGQATLDLPEGYGYVPKQQAQQLLEAWGNGEDSSVEGLVFPTSGDKQNWFVVVSWEKTGFIKDDDAKTWDPAEMLQSMKDGTEQLNEERQARGIPAMHVKGWAEVPQYDEKTHRLVWSLIATNDGDTDENQATINYNTVMLGREGKISMNMVTAVSELPALRPVANALLADLSYVKGKTYADFDASSDNVAEYGLAGLIAGGFAAKKLGLFAVLAAFFAKFAKLIIGGLVAVGYVLKNWFGRKKPDAAE